MKTHDLLLSGLVLPTLLGLASAALADSHPARGPRPPIEEIDLSDEQRRQIDGLPEARKAWRDENLDRLKEIGKQSKAARQAGDDEALARLEAERQEIVKTRPSMQSILTDAQRQQIRELNAARAESRQEQIRQTTKEQRRAARPKRTARELPPELRELMQGIAAAQRAGDKEEEERLKNQLRELQRAVRERRAAGAEE